MKIDYRYELAGIRRFSNPELYKKTVEFQNLLAENGIAWHNPFSDECTDDFGCCTGKGEYDTYFPSYEVAIKEHLENPHNQ